MKKVLVIFITLLIFIFIGCASNVSKNADKQVSYEKPEIKKDTNLGSDLPEIIFESEHQIIFDHGLGIFIYDLDNSKMLRAIKPLDSNILLNAQGNSTGVVLVDDKKQIITIHEIYLDNKSLDYYYKYDIKKDKLYKCPIEELNIEVQEPIVTGQWDTSDWTAWNSFYKSKLTGKTYYPFRDIIK